MHSQKEQYFYYIILAFAIMERNLEASLQIYCMNTDYSTAVHVCV